MKTFYVSGRYAEISSGKLILTANQAKSRRHALKPIKGDCFEIIAPTGFKHGESFQFDGSIPRALAVNISEQASRSALEDLPQKSLFEFAVELGIKTSRNASKSRLLDLIAQRRAELVTGQAERVDI